MDKSGKDQSTKIPSKLIDEVRSESQKARDRFYVPFVYLLLDYIKASDCGKNKVEYNNPLRLTACGSEMKVYEENTTHATLPMCKAAYRNNEECYERYCVRLYNRGLFEKYKTGEYSVAELLKNDARYDLIELAKKYDITNIED